MSGPCPEVPDRRPDDNLAVTRGSPALPAVVSHLFRRVPGYVVGVSKRGTVAKVAIAGSASILVMMLLVLMALAVLIGAGWLSVELWYFLLFHGDGP